MATDGHGGEFAPSGPTHDLGYEPDKFPVKTILVVPGVVLATILVVYIITTVIFDAFFAPKGIVPPPDVPAAAERNSAPLNERFDRISSTNPNAEVLQPRLEGLQKREIYGKNGDKNAISSEMITTQPLKDGNPPRYHAEDLRPDRVAATSKPWKDQSAGATRIPVDEAIKLASNPNNAAWAKALSAREGALPLDVDPNWDRPKESNGGNARLPAPHKKETPPEAKKEAEKKEPGKQ
jgi:hypothetical protein